MDFFCEFEGIYKDGKYYEGKELLYIIESLDFSYYDSKLEIEYKSGEPTIVKNDFFSNDYAFRSIKNFFSHKKDDL